MIDPLTEAEVRADLDAGRDRPLTIPAPLAPRRPRAGGGEVVRTVLAARVGARLHLPGLERLLDRLWFTPWTVGEARARPDGARTFDVPFDGGALRGWHVGDGPAVLLVHGWGGHGTDLREVATRLAGAGHRAYAIDLPAHGASPGARTDVFELGRAVATVAAAIGPLEAVVAHSMGSVATLVAVRDGLSVDRVALLAPPAALETALSRTMRRTGLRGTGETRLRRHLERRFGPQVWEDVSVAGLAPTRPLSALVVHDADDREVPVGEGLRVARALGAEMVVTSGLGHGRVLLDEAVLERVVAHASGPGPARTEPDPGAHGRPGDASAMINWTTSAGSSSRAPNSSRIWVMR